MEARHLKITDKQAHAVCLVVGDHGRVDKLKVLCDSFVDLAFNREYKSVECTYKGEKFLCVSHGVGSAGAAICFEELIQIGVKVIIRLGSCGSLQPDTIKRGDICICHAAVREDGVSRLLLPTEYPAVADVEVHGELIKSANQLNVKHHTGITLTSDLYYPGPILPSNLENYSKANVDVAEMEVATLFIIGSLKKIKTGSVLIVDGSPLKWNEGDIDTNLHAENLENMIKIGLETSARLAKKYKI